MWCIPVGIQGDQQQLYFMISLWQVLKYEEMVKPKHFCWAYIWTFWYFDVSIWPGEKILPFMAMQKQCEFSNLQQYKGD